MRSAPFESWLAALDDRHLADLTAREVARALRALSSCYVERRAKLAEGESLATRGKRAAFALFYGPLHFLVVREVVRRLPGAGEPMNGIVDLGSGTGAAGAAWALESETSRVDGIDRHPWAAAETSWTYRVLGLQGRGRQGDVTRTAWRTGSSAGVLAAYVVNELPSVARAALLQRFVTAHRAGSRVLVVEPIARAVAPWWSEWRGEFESEGGRADEWRIPASLPQRQRSLARAAGLDPQTFTARTLWLP